MQTYIVALADGRQLPGHLVTCEAAGCALPEPNHIHVAGDEFETVTVETTGDLAALMAPHVITT